VSSAPPSLVDLELAEFRAWKLRRETSASPPRRGWHGMRARPQGKYTKEDWLLWGGRLAGVGVLVDAAPGSPAWNAGIINGTWILLIDGKSFALFEETRLQAGTAVSVKAFRPECGNIDVELVLGVRPKPSRPRKVFPIASVSGALVTKKDRPKWLMQVSGCTGLTSADRAVAMRLATKYARERAAAFPAVARLAADLSVSKSTVERGLARLRTAGFVKIVSGRKSGRVNHYFITWPAPADSNVTPLQRR
jgi:hypothetical protein